MLVISLTVCPNALRGDLSRWLLEIDTGVYVGQISHRVREELWLRITKHVKDGRAVMVYTARNEQKMDFRVHNAAWEPIDFDGIKLMLRPNRARQLIKQKAVQEPAKPGFSLASKMQMAKRMEKARAAGQGLPETYVVLDIETTGLNPSEHDIIELGAIQYRLGQETDVFQALLFPRQSIPLAVQTLTGISQQEFLAQGQTMEDVLPDFLYFLGDKLLIGHNIAFDMDFLFQACIRHNLSLPANQRIDTMSLARRYAPKAGNYQLPKLLQYFDINGHTSHRAIPDCRATHDLLLKLIEIRDSRL